MDSMEAGHSVRLRFSNPGQRTSTTNRGFYHVQKREESTGTLGPAPGGAGSRVPLKQPDGGNDDRGRRPRSAQALCRNRVIRPAVAGTIMVKGAMRAYVVIIFQITFQKLPQLLFIEHDHSIRAFTSNRTHQALDHRDVGTPIARTS